MLFTNLFGTFFPTTFFKTILSVIKKISKLSNICQNYSKQFPGPFAPDHLLGSKQSLKLGQLAGYTTLQDRKLLLQVGFLVLARVSQDMEECGDLGFVCCVSVPLLAQ